MRRVMRQTIMRKTVEKRGEKEVSHKRSFMRHRQIAETMLSWQLSFRRTEFSETR